jgi:hypothetical protein
VEPLRLLAKGRRTKRLAKKETNKQDMIERDKGKIFESL